MKLHFRIFIVYFLLLGVAGYYLYTLSVDQIKPATRQASEEVLVDMANLLAEIVASEWPVADFEQSQFAAQVGRFLNRSLAAKIFSIEKSRSNLRLYITDNQGIVRYYSGAGPVPPNGADYSQWNDVYLTLQGKYGARSTADIAGNPLTSVMYVAAPIRRGDDIIGVLTVGKPGIDSQPFMDRIISRLKRYGFWILLISLIAGMMLSYGLTHAIRKLTRYAKAVSKGKPVALPKFSDSEMRLLAESMEDMRGELEGKRYVEHYVHSLTHELKSPISAINGASELIDQHMDTGDFVTLKTNLQKEAARLHTVVNRLLELVRVENISVLKAMEPIPMHEVIQAVVDTKRALCKHRGITLEVHTTTVIAKGDRFLLQHCLDNLLQNALDFSSAGQTVVIACTETATALELKVIDEGEGIPDYAIASIFERFYSLQRPNGGGKSSGIGLSFVKQVVQLHAGKVTITNRVSGGVVATVHLPLQKYLK